MNMNFKVIFHFENVPTFLQELCKADFVNCRHEVVDVFNTKIEKINSDWDKLNKPASLGDDLIDPEYSKFVNSYFDEDIAKINARHAVHCALDEYSDIIGYIPGIPNSKISITLEEMN